MTPNTAFKQLTITPAANGFLLSIRGQPSGVYVDVPTMLADVKAYCEDPTILPWTGQAVVTNTLPTPGVRPSIKPTPVPA